MMVIVRLDLILNLLKNQSLKRLLQSKYCECCLFRQQTTLDHLLWPDISRNSKPRFRLYYAVHVLLSQSYEFYRFLLLFLLTIVLPFLLAFLKFNLQSIVKSTSSSTCGIEHARADDQIRRALARHDTSHFHISPCSMDKNSILVLIISNLVIISDLFLDLMMLVILEQEIYVIVN